MVSCISAAVLTTISCFVSSLVNLFIVLFMPPPRAPIITGTIVTVYPDLLSFVSKVNCRYRVSLSLGFVSIFYCLGYAMSQMQICFSSFVSSIKSGLLVVSVFHRLNCKSQTSFVSSFSKSCLAPIVPCTTPCQLQSTNSCSFAQVTAIIISVLSCLANYTLLSKTVHPAARCSTVSLCP